LAETQWAFPASSASDDEHEDDAAADTNETGLLHGSRSVEVYVTRPSGPRSRADASAAGVFAIDPDDDVGEVIEMQENEQLLDMEEQMEKSQKGMLVKSGRPDLSNVVDEVFSKGMRTAVICCGPKRLTDDLKRNVEVWVKKGHDVFWYDETFGW
jgi:hypothetical protein